MLRREERVHIRGSGCSDAAADGTGSSPYAAHADRHPVANDVPSPWRIRHEHPVSPDSQTGASLHFETNVLNSKNESMALSNILRVCRCGSTPKCGKVS